MASKSLSEAVKCFLLVGFRFVHVNILAKKRESPYLQSHKQYKQQSLHTYEKLFYKCWTKACVSPFFVL